VDIKKITDLKDRTANEIIRLLEYNKEKTKTEPEQCRKNLETIVSCLEKLNFIH